MKLSIFLIVAAIACSCANNQQTSSLTDKQVDSILTNDTTLALLASNKTEPTATWSYDSCSDKMDGKKGLFATCTSTNQVYFDFPYNGGSTFTLMVRNEDHQNNVILLIDKGQFQTGIEGSYGRIKFDDEEPMRITYNESTTSRSDLVFLSPASKIISKLKKAKKVMIETQFFQEGRQQAEFNVEGLKWDH
jgi:hypothetical protein